MKAKELKKTSRSIEDIYGYIKMANEKCEYKCFVPHYVFVDESIKLQLIEDGFKVYRGNWDNIMIDALIIEW